MLNQNHNVHKRTNSKILLIILCIFGLLFSYSCKCRNQISDPNNIPPDNGIIDNTITNPTPYIPRTYTATRSGDTLIIVSSDGQSITPAKISFQDAKVTNVTVDAGTTGIAADVFKYENGGLTMTNFDNVTTTRQKVTATFSLAPDDSRDKLDNPTENVDIEVVKSKGAFDKKVSIGTTIKDIFSYNPHDNITLQFKNEPEDDKIVLDVDITQGAADNTDIDKNDFVEKLKTKIVEKVTGATSIDFVSDATGTDTHSFVYNFKFPSGYGDYEQTEDQLQNGIEYTIEIKTKGPKSYYGDEKTITFK